MLIISLIFNKYKWLFFFDALCWLFIGIYCISHQDATQPFILYFGLFCFAMFVAMGFIPFFIHRVPKSYVDQMDIKNWDKDNEDSD